MKIKNIYTEDHKYIVNKLINARKDKKLTQSQVAKKLKKSQSYVSKIESCQLKIDVVELKEFSALYDKGIEYFIKK
jgi:transcriptional regulator with XRE-family HTH domain